jgi:hypothetical protein
MTDTPLKQITSNHMPVANRTSYSLGFTAVSLRPDLARVVAECYLVTGDWRSAKERILSSNALQCRSASSAIRLERELRQRLERLTTDQIKLLAHSNAEDRASMAWLAALKHIRFVFEFAAEVLRDKLGTHDHVLRHSDYETYVANKSVSHPELAKLTNSSKSKIQQVLLRMLAEGGLLTAGAALGTIRRPVLSPGVLRAIITDNPPWLAGFLVPDNEIKRL